jgi:hypothetical protein
MASFEQEEKDRLWREYLKVKFDLAKLASVVTCRGFAEKAQIENWKNIGWSDHFKLLSTWLEHVEEFYRRYHNGEIKDSDHKKHLDRVA